MAYSCRSGLDIVTVEINEDGRKFTKFCTDRFFFFIIKNEVLSSSITGN